MTRCPAESVLISFERGGLSEADAAPLARHVAECEDCGSALQRIRESDKDGKMLRMVFEDAGGKGLIEDDPPVESSDCVTALDSRGGVQTPPGGPGQTADPAERLGSPSRTPSGVNPEAPMGSGAAGSIAWPIPDYERVALCGEGSYGSVWAVRDRVGVYRALKLIDLDRLEKAKVTCYELSALETYCRKVTRHPYLITVYHVGVVGRTLYYTMELADDQQQHGAVTDPFPPAYRPLTLATLIRGGRLRIDIAVEIARRLLRGLAKLHDLDLLHRDVKPSNIIFVNRHPKLADIGILMAQHGSSKVVGTPKYMPPDRTIDKTADVYAMGTVLHEMIEAGSGTGEGDVAESTRWDTVRLSEVIARACANRSADRYASAAAMLEDLEACRFLSGESLLDEVAAGLSTPPPAKSNAAVQLAFAFAHRLPWIVLLIVALYALSKL